MRSADKSSGFSAPRPGQIFAILLIAAIGLLWISPADVSSVRNGLHRVLEPGESAVRWVAYRAYRVYQRANTELPAHDALSAR